LFIIESLIYRLTYLFVECLRICCKGGKSVEGGGYINFLNGIFLSIVGIIEILCYYP